MKRLIWLVLLLILLWSGYWAAATWGKQQAIMAWVAARQADGWVAEVGAAQMGGYPTHLTTRLEEVMFADPDTGVAWSAPFLSLSAEALSPTNVTASFAPNQTLASPEKRYDIAVADMLAEVAVMPDAQLSLSVLRLTGSETTIRSEDGTHELAAWQLGAEATAETTYDIGLNLDGYAPALPVTLPQGLPDRLETVVLKMTASFDRPWDLRALDTQRPQPRRIDLDRAQAVWGPMDIWLAGEVDIDAAGQPDGVVQLRLRNWRAALDLARSSGSFSPGLIDGMEEALSLVAQLNGGGKDIDATLNLGGGRVWLGPLPIAPAPVLRLR